MYRAVRLAALALASALILPASAAQAKGGACLPDYPHGAHCHVWTGKVTQVDDGDTLDASVPGDGLGGVLRVRIIGIQAMELTSYRTAAARGRLPRGRRHPPARAAGQAVEGQDPRQRALHREPLARPPAALDRGPPRRALARRRPHPRLRGPRPVVAGARRGRLERALQPAVAEGGGRAQGPLRPRRVRHRPQPGSPDRPVGAVGRGRQRPRRRQRRVREDPQLRRQQLAAARAAGTCATRACGASPSRPAPPSRPTAP